MTKWTRRAFIATGSIVGGGLAIGLAGIALAPNRMSLLPQDASDAPYLTTWIKIGRDSHVTIIVPHCEMGQGVHTALAMMLAEELEADWALVRVEEAPADGAFANGYVAPVFGLLPMIKLRKCLPPVMRAKHSRAARRSFNRNTACPSWLMQRWNPSMQPHASPTIDVKFGPECKTLCMPARWLLEPRVSSRSR